MLRTLSSALAAGVLAVSLAACSASGGQSGCSGAGVQSYPPPLLVNPTSGSAHVPDNIGVIQISTTTPTVVGSLSLTSGSGASVPIGAISLAAQQPNPNAYVWNVKIGGLAASTTYFLRQTVQYPGACLGPIVTKTQLSGSFTSA